MSAQTPGEPRKDVAATVQAMADNARAKSRAKQRDELAARHAAGQLALWPESERGIPNELVRCAVFSAKNRKERREEISRHVTGVGAIYPGETRSFSVTVEAVPAAPGKRRLRH